MRVSRNIAFLFSFLVAGSVWAQNNNSRSVPALPSSPLPEPVVVTTAPPGKFIPIRPCRIVDTRGGAPFVGGAFGAGEARDYQLSASVAPCDGLPTTVSAFSLNITVTQAGGPGFIAAYPRGVPPVPLVSTLNYETGQTIANAAIVPTDAQGFITLVAGVSGTHVIVDVNGYYQEGTDGRAWAYVTAGSSSFARSKGFATITHPSTGVYCLAGSSGVSPGGSAVMVTVEWGSSSGFDLLAYPVDIPFNCPANTFEVRTYKFGASPASPALSDLIAFYIFIP